MQFAPYVSMALRDLPVSDEEDRAWLFARMAYFAGEYFAQKHGWCCYVNDIEGSKYFGRSVVGRFSSFQRSTLMLDPFEIAQAYVDTSPPRQLDDLLAEVDAGRRKTDLQ